MKFVEVEYIHGTFLVAPFTGAWIEIHYTQPAVPLRWHVAPFTGAWIEIKQIDNGGKNGRVAPFTGAWIEIMASKPIFAG